jgi:hypothetical protein
MTAVSKVQIDRVAQATGLRRGTVMDLLDSGWAYNETLNQMPKWQKPGPEITRGIAGLAPFKQITMPTEKDAKDVVKRLEELIERYGDATVGDLMAAVGLKHTFRDEGYGWKTSNGITLRPVKDGWELRFPDPEYLV